MMRKHPDGSKTYPGVLYVFKSAKKFRNLFQSLFSQIIEIFDLVCCNISM